MITMYDAVDVTALPTDAAYVALYVDRPNNYAAGRVRCPHAKILTITTTGVPADCCDCELGDLTVPQVQEWVIHMINSARYRPCVYAGASTWNGGLLAALETHGEQIRRWVAAWPGGGEVIPPGFDAHQFSSTSVDTSVCLDNFFEGGTPHPDHDHGTAHFKGSHNLTTGDWSVRGTPGLGVHFAGPKQRASAEIQVEVGAGGGQWYIKGIPFNSAPLGGPTH